MRWCGVPHEKIQTSYFLNHHNVIHPYMFRRELLRLRQTINTKNIYDLGLGLNLI